MRDEALRIDHAPVYQSGQIGIVELMVARHFSRATGQTVKL